MNGRHKGPGVNPKRVPRWQGELAVLLGYGVLSIVLTWPLAAHWTEAVLGPPGDNLEYVWKMWWFKHALLDKRVSPFFNPDVFYPFGYPLALSETTLTHTLLGLPLTWLFGEVVAYNLVVLFSFILSGYGLYLLLRELRVGMAGAFLGGVAFAFCPYRMAHVGAGHLPLLGTGWIPLLFWALERFLASPSWRRGIPLGGLGALLALSSWYYAFMVFPFVGLYPFLRGWPWRSRAWWRQALPGLGLALTLMGILLAPAAWPTLQLYAQGELAYDFSLGYIDQWSASPVDFLYPNAMHSLWGAGLTRHYYQNIHENLLYLGWSVLALAGVGLFWHRRERLPRAFAWLGGLAFILALGTSLHFAGRPIYLRVPPKVEYQFARMMYVLTGKLALNKVDFSPLRREGAIILPLPTLFLYLFVPPMRAMRVWARFGIVVMFSVAVLAGWGVERILARKGRSWVLALLGFVLIDFAVLPYPYGYTLVRGQPVDEWLARQAHPSPVIHYPLEKTWFGWMLYPTRIHGQPIAYGYGTFTPKAYRQAARTLARWPAAEAVDLLRRWGVRYVLVGARSYGTRWPALQKEMAAIPGLQQVAVFEDRPLYRGDRLLHLVPPSPQVPVTELVNGPQRAYLADRVYVYMLK